MNDNQMNAIRDLAERTFSSGDCAIISGDRVLAINLHKERAEEWASFYKGASVVMMKDIK